MAPTTQLLTELKTTNKALITTAQNLHDKEGLSWGVIGGALGMTPQAASRRFGQANVSRITGARGAGTTGVTRSRAGGRRGR